MKIVVLGSGSAYSAPGRFNSCYYVEAEKEKFLIDCGSDALRAIQQAGVDLFAIRQIFVTHMHADHAAGLPSVLTAMHVAERKDPVKVYIPFTQVEFVRLWLANMYVYNERMSFETTLVPLKPGIVGLGKNVELEFVQTGHLEKYRKYADDFGINPVSFSVAVRENEKRFFFSSDLASLEETNGHLKDGISLVEATHPALEEVASFAKAGGAGIYFTHIPMELEDGGKWRLELAAKFGIEKLNAVRDGQVFVL